MNYNKKTKITVMIAIILVVIITGSVLVFKARGIDFPFWKASVYSAAFPYERISDISAEDMSGLILDTLRKPEASIYLHTSYQYISLNTDYTLKELTSHILISDYKKGMLHFKPYRISIFPDSKKMNIYPYKGSLAADIKSRYCTFDVYWNALSCIPLDAANKTIAQDEPDYYQLWYTPHDLYGNTSLRIKHFFYDVNGVVANYRQSPSVMFDFWPMYEDKENPGEFSGIGMTILYYYDYAVIEP